MTTVDRASIAALVKEWGWDPKQISVVAIDKDRTTYTSVSRTTTQDVSQWLEGQGIDTKGVINVEIDHDAVRVTRYTYDRYGIPLFAVDVNNGRLVYEYETKVYPIA